MPRSKYGELLGSFTAEQLAGGLNLCSATADGWQPGGPWDAEAGALMRLTDSRFELLDAQLQMDAYLPAHPMRASLRGQGEVVDSRIVALQRNLVRPRPFHFSIRPAAK